MKKIVLFITDLSSGGAEHQIALLASFLAEKGYNVTLVTYSDCDDYYSYSDEITRIHLASGKSKFSKILAIFKYFLFIKADTVISFGPRNNALCLLPLLFRARIKVISGERGLYRGAIPFYNKLDIKWLYRRSNYIVPNSYSQRDELISLNEKLAPKIKVITNFTDLSVYKSTLLPHNKILQIGIFARFSQQKNYVRFAEAVKILKQNNTRPFNIAWYGAKKVGENDNVHYKAFQKLIEEYDISDVLQLHDAVKDVPERIPLFDLMCLPSLWEGFSNTLSEYICCGRPVIASDVADNGVMVKDGINGFLFNPTEVTEIVSCFENYFSLPDEKTDQMAHESRNIAEELFSKEKFANSYVQLIES